MNRNFCYQTTLQNNKRIRLVFEHEQWKSMKIPMKLLELFFSWPWKDKKLTSIYVWNAILDRLGHLISEVPFGRNRLGFLRASDCPFQPLWLSPFFSSSKRARFLSANPNIKQVNFLPRNSHKKNHLLQKWITSEENSIHVKGRWLISAEKKARIFLWKYQHSLFSYVCSEV